MDVHFPSSETNRATTLVDVARRFIGGGFLRMYTTAALVILDTLLLLVIINLMLGAVYTIRDAKTPAPRPSAPSLVAPNQLFTPDGSPASSTKRNGYQQAWIDFHAYGEADPAYVADVLDDFYDLGKSGMVYQPWVEFAEPTFHGKRVIVEPDRRGFLTRHTANPINDAGLPLVKLFTFGGSTTFGYNVSDEQTWPSYLSHILNQRAKALSLGFRIEVVNYGRGYYYPSQETALLIDLLKNGHRPQMAIFLDGVNTGEDQDVPEFYERLKDDFRKLQQPAISHSNSVSLEPFKWIPLVRFADSLAVRLQGTKPLTVAQRESSADLQKVRHHVNMFRQNRDIAKAICKLYSVEPLFFLQPHAVYNYPVTLYRRSLPDEFYQWRVHATALYEQMRTDAGVIYLGDLFETWGRKAIIDELHYSPAFHQFLAEHIADRIDLTTLDPSRKGFDEEASAGNPRI